MKTLRISAAHEAQHIRSLDVLVKTLCAFAAAVNWFNPLAWVMLTLSGRDIELACDERVLRRFGDEPVRAKKYRAGAAFADAEKFRAGDEALSAEPRRAVDEAVGAENRRVGNEPVVAENRRVGNEPVVAENRRAGNQPPRSKNRRAGKASDNAENLRFRDDIVIPRKDYVLCLIDAVGADAGLPSFGGNAVYERIRHIMDKKKITLWTAAFAALVMLISASVFVKAAVVEKEPESETSDGMGAISSETTPETPDEAPETAPETPDEAPETAPETPDETPETVPETLDGALETVPETSDEVPETAPAEQDSARDFVFPLAGSLSVNYDYGEKTLQSGGVIFHNGIDLAAEAGDPVYSPIGGVVSDAGYNVNLGNYVVVSDGGFEILAGHLSELLVKSGDSVSAGQEIGKVGSTGMSTGDVLHFEVRVDGVNVDPSEYIGER